MKQPQFKKYLKLLALITLLILVLAGGFNWLVDPYSVYGSPKIKNFNALKPEEITHARMTKAYLVRRLSRRQLSWVLPTQNGASTPTTRGGHITRYSTSVFPVGIIMRCSGISSMPIKYSR
jgi:hypothetical protein